LGAATGRDDLTQEAADLLYFLLVRTTAAGIGLEQIEAELDRRERRVTRRPMVAKDAT
jgi:phosphoribosyl-ATP pyrophosphohydrolase/phosphoribosyl-AMP cyclohydrolase/histidinol dehydrogenase